MIKIISDSQIFDSIYSIKAVLKIFVLSDDLKTWKEEADLIFNGKLLHSVKHDCLKDSSVSWYNNNKELDDL